MSVALLQPSYSSFDIETAIFASCGHATLPVPYTPGEPLVEALRIADAVLLRDMPFKADAIGQLENCKVIVRYGVGVNNVDLAAATARKIIVCNAAGYDTDEVSNHAISLYLALRRRLFARTRDVRSGVWGVDEKEPIDPIRESVIGLIGFGAIARSLLRKMRVFGDVTALVFDPFARDADLAALGAVRASVDDIARQATFISLHAPLTPETHHILGKAQFACMRPDAIVVNTARGGLIDMDALAAALQAGQIQGAGIDVFEQEPPDVRHPLFALDNVILTDHAGWYSTAAVRSIRTLAALEAARVLKGEAPRSWVNPW